MQTGTLQTRAGGSIEQDAKRAARSRTTIVRIISVIVPAIAMVAVLVPVTNRARADGTTTVRKVDKFRVGWFDSLSGSANLSSIRQEGMDAVMPYTDNSDVVGYLNRARESGVEVVLEIDRALVRAADPAAVAAWVAKYKHHPAISGWYLADEPSINASLGNPSPATLQTLYGTVKAEDPSRPVVVAFSSSPGDDLTAYESSYDVAMWDDYPCKKYQLEYANMDAWRYRVDVRGAAASSKQGWIPIIQAFQLNNWRLPTAGELRYMTYSAVQSGATGVFYWARYRSTPTWINNTLKPMTAEVSRLAPSLAKGTIAHASTSSHGNVVSTTHRDPITGKYSLIVVNHGSSRVDVKISLSSALGVTLAKAGNVTTTIDRGVLAAGLNRFEARVYDLS
jgi:hypothetical protein